jgi:hypothetical protein
MKTLTNKQINMWNKLRFGNMAPKQIRKHFTKLCVTNVRKNGYTFTGSELDCPIVMVDSTQNWFTYDKKDDMAFLQFKYVPILKTFFVVNQEDNDFGVHIGWCDVDQMPSFSVVNNHNQDDMFGWTFTDKNSDAQTIARSMFASLCIDVLSNYNHSKRKTSWLKKVEGKIFQK